MLARPACRRKESIHQREKPSLLLMKAKYNKFLVLCNHRQMIKRRSEWAQQEVVRLKYLTTKNKTTKKKTHWDVYWRHHNLVTCQDLPNDKEKNLAKQEAIKLQWLYTCIPTGIHSHIILTRSNLVIAAAVIYHL